MDPFRFFWTAHKWTGLTLGVVFLVTAVTGLLLLWKKEFAYLQPPTQQGVQAPLADFLSLDEVWHIVAAQQHADFRTADDVDRIDVRPGKYVYKVRSRHNDTEMQIDASTGAVLRIDTRRSDFLERVHDGSWISDGVKVFVMPLVALGLLFLVFSGTWIWLHPKIRRARRRKAHARRKPSTSASSD